MNNEDCNKKTLKILADAADLNKDGYVFGNVDATIYIYLFFFNSLIAYDEFKQFEELLCSPDVLYKCAFQLFDKKGTGLIDFGKNFFFFLQFTY
jgi:solute carrier family 25 aspartate/glutamate transporter 12/13